MNKFLRDKIVPKRTGIIFDKFSFDVDDYPEKLRSDKFTTEHDGLHILFAGCSVTYGIGLEDNEIWTNLLLDKIKETHKVSGMYSTARIGHGISNQIVHIISYISKYGAPDYIFFNLPNIHRLAYIDWKAMDNAFWNDLRDPPEPLVMGIAHLHRNKAGTPLTIDDDLGETLMLSIHLQSYAMLEMVCKIHGIKLISFSWSDCAVNYFETQFDSFKKIDINGSFGEHLYNTYDAKKDPYGLLARDGEHHGTLYHQHWANEVFNRFKET